MTELTYGDRIEVNDKVCIHGLLCNVQSIHDGFCIVRINRKTTIQLPVIYSEEFKKPDSQDRTQYIVFRDDL